MSRATRAVMDKLLQMLCAETVRQLFAVAQQQAQAWASTQRVSFSRGIHPGGMLMGRPETRRVPSRDRAQAQLSQHVSVTVADH